MIRTLVVDDDYRVAGIHAAYVARVPGFTAVGQARTAAEATRAIASLKPALVLLDLYLPDGHGLALIRELAGSAAGCPDFIVITAARDVASVRDALRLGALHYLVKPFGFDTLRERLTAYHNVTQRLASMREADQGDVDELYSLLRVPAGVPQPLPKRHSAPTLALVREAVGQAVDDVSASQVAETVGISRPTAQRYLSYLAQQGAIELRLRYGGQGRPEQRYRANGKPSR
ncbi:MAG: response regulator [Sciscionella sp.]